MQRGKVSQACPQYAESMRLDPQLGALLHLADCYEKNGQLASAWSSFRQAEELARQRGDDRLAIAHEYAARLESKLDRLNVVVTEPLPSNLEVRVDGRVMSANELKVATPIDPGTHVVEARAPGREPWSSSVSVVGGRQVVRVDVPELRASSAAEAQLATVPPGPSASPLRVVGWLGVGAGALGLGVGGLFLAKRSARLDERADVCPSLHDCTKEQSDRIGALTTQARSADVLASVGFVAGGVLLAGGVTALIVGANSPPRRAAWLAPVVTAKGLTVAGGLQW
jgi:hypothetical protein